MSQYAKPQVEMPDTMVVSKVSSQKASVNAAVVHEISNLFSLAEHIDLETGIENEFSQRLEKVIEEHGELALEEIRKRILQE